MTRRFKCPKCEKAIEWKEDWDSGFCPWCGAPITFYDRNKIQTVEHTTKFKCPQCGLDLVLHTDSRYSIQTNKWGPHAGDSVTEGKLKEITGIPDEYRIGTVIFIGYEGDIELLDEKNREREKKPSTRRPLSEIVHWDRW